MRTVPRRAELVSGKPGNDGWKITSPGPAKDKADAPRSRQPEHPSAHSASYRTGHPATRTAPQRIAVAQRPTRAAADRHVPRRAAAHTSACRINGVPARGQTRRLRSWFMPQNFLFPQRDQPLLLPADMREWLPEDDLVHVVLDAVATLDLGRYRADGHGRAAFDPEMMVALLLYGYCQGERSSRVIERRCVR